MDIKATFHFYAVENQPYIGAYRAGSFTEGNPQIMFAMDFHTYTLKDISKEELTDSFKDGVLQTLTHEFCHAMQEMLDKDFDELEVEKILGAYKSTWNVFEAPGAEELPEEVFKISDLLRWIDNVDCETAADFKDALNNLFMGHRQWIEAHGMTKYESLKKELEDTTATCKKWYEAAMYFKDMANLGISMADKNLNNPQP